MNKNILLEQVSNAECQSSPLYLEACYSALKIAMKELDEEGTPPAHDFESAMEQVDRSYTLRKPKQQVFGEMLAALLRTFDAHALFLPREVVQTIVPSENSDPRVSMV